MGWQRRKAWVCGVGCKARSMVGCKGDAWAEAWAGGVGCKARIMWCPSHAHKQG
ncbi:hypothetical protein PIB30_104835, partial [Stylosanthes scabra]|nr:hypothetical protein [Stylosanthes scabra]